MSEWDLNNLKDTVTKILVTRYDFTVDEADDVVNDSVVAKPELWHHNSDPADLAKYLAEDDDED